VRLHPGVASGNLGVEREALSMGGEKQSDMPRREPVRRVATVECGEISAYARHMVSISAPVDRYTVSVDEYVRFRSEGFLIVRGLVATDEVQELLSHVDYLLTGRVEVPGAPAFGADNKTAETRLDHLLRIHMLHRRLQMQERFMLHPRVLDVVQALGGPDVLALQTMLFVKRPGSAGQGYHQDSFHIITQPDTLVGAWLALDPADEENGCLRVTAGSQHEPVYPDVDEQAGHGGDRLLADIPSIAGADDPDERRNELTAVAAKYEGREVAAVVEPGDVVFFGGHVLHRSHANASATRSRRSFVAHYCNARSHVPWDDEPLQDGEMGNGRHILARGETRLPYAHPKFGTPCAANGYRDEAATSPRP
jgi:phytanoyl-CoA hydroxylase